MQATCVISSSANAVHITSLAITANFLLSKTAESFDSHSKTMVDFIQLAQRMRKINIFWPWTTFPVLVRFSNVLATTLVFYFKKKSLAAKYILKWCSNNILVIKQHTVQTLLSYNMFQLLY